MGKKYHKKSFTEKNQNLLIVLVIIGVALFLLFNNNLIPQSIVPPNENSTLPPASTQPVDNVDLRIVFAPYAITDVQSTCLAMGETWVYERDQVGCVGAGPTNCNDPLILAAGTQCLGVGANWVCNPSNVYCIK
jgi:hypothetical protein